MQLTQEVYAFAPATLQISLDETIIQIVEDHDGIKDTALTIAVLAEIADEEYTRSSTDPFFAASMVAKSIHNLINIGCLVGIDCETPSGSFTFVLPAKTRPRIAVPIILIDNRTRH